MIIPMILAALAALPSTPALATGSNVHPTQYILHPGTPLVPRWRPRRGPETITGEGGMQLGPGDLVTVLPGPPETELPSGRKWVRVRHNDTGLTGYVPMTWDYEGQQVPTMSHDRSHVPPQPTINFQSTEKRKKFIEAARRYLGVKYAWGQNSMSGMDCSGLVFQANKESQAKPGFHERTADSQYKKSKQITDINQVKEGDLAFTDTPRSQLGKGPNQATPPAGTPPAPAAARPGRTASQPGEMTHVMICTEAKCAKIIHATGGSTQKVVEGSAPTGAKFGDFIQDQGGTTP